MNISSRSKILTAALGAKTLEKDRSSIPNPVRPVRNVSTAHQADRKARRRNPARVCLDIDTITSPPPFVS